jgi:glycosyltransferase involved in cell wall biosynthesis
MDISVVIPLYNEDESLGELYSWISKVMLENNFSFEVIFMNDGSTDNSWGVIQELASKNDNVKGVRFRKNQGKSNALNVGFGHTQGDVVITMDADLQDSPEEIPELYRLIKEDGFDLISGWKQKRYDPITKTLPTKLFNWATRKISKIQLHDFNCGLKSYRSDVVKSITVYGEMHRYIPFLAKNVGFNKIGEKVVSHQARKYGVTKFGLDRFINGFLDLATLAMISKFGRRPMHFFGLLGTLMFFLSIVSLAVMGGLKLYALGVGEKAGLVADNPWFYIMLATTIIGTQLFLIGFLAEIVLRQSNKPTNYTITEMINISE